MVNHRHKAINHGYLVFRVHCDRIWKIDFLVDKCQSENQFCTFSTNYVIKITHELLSLSNDLNYQTSIHRKQ